MKTNALWTLVITSVLALLFTAPVNGQEYQNYVVANGKLVPKSGVKDLTGVLLQKNLWLVGADKQSHPACIVQLDGSTKGVFVQDYRPTTPVGKWLRVRAVSSAPDPHPASDVRSATGSLDKSVDGNHSAKVYIAVRDATAIDYKISKRAIENAAE